MRSSLREGIEAIGIISHLLTEVRKPSRYAIINETHILKKSRRNGLPDDDARKALRGHRTRLLNLDRGRMDETQRAILAQRRGNIKVAENAYIALQQEALVIDPKASKDQGMDLAP